MKISELIAVLDARMKTHGDRQVQITWEGSVSDMRPDNIYIGRAHIGDPLVLIIDAENNYYKPRFALDPNEGNKDDVEALAKLYNEQKGK